jgi:hypothetical protein
MLSSSRIGFSANMKRLEVLRFIQIALKDFIAS